MKPALPATKPAAVYQVFGLTHRYGAQIAVPIIAAPLITPTPMANPQLPPSIFSISCNSNFFIFVSL